MSKKEYWNMFYNSTPRAIDNESSFAVFVKNFMTKKVLELGCGNARDTFYLQKYCKEILAIDSSQNTIKKLVEKQKNKIIFECIDVSNISSLTYQPTFIYNRFFLHSIDEAAEAKLFQYISKLPSKTIFSIECRSEKDMELPKHFGKTHYRRGINFKNLIYNLEELDYEILYSIESDNLSPFMDENPIIIRVISRKK